MLAQSSSIIASIRAGTWHVGAEADGWRCKQSEGVDERAVPSPMCSKLGRKERRRSEWGDRSEDNGGVKGLKFS